MEEQARARGLHRLFAEVSITARPFFAAKGFAVAKRQAVVRRGVALVNFVMEKRLG